MDPSDTEPELALRFSLSAADFAACAGSALLDAPIPRARRSAEIFHDSADFTLARQGIGLSLTKARRGFTQRLTQHGAAQESLVPEAEPELSALPPDWAVNLPALLQGVALQPVFSLVLKRVLRRAGPVALTFESGHIAAGGQSLPVRELALRGPAAQLYRLALALAGEFPLVLQPVELATRAMWAASTLRPRVARAGPGLSGGPSLDEAVAALTQSCLTQFTANWPVFALGDEVSAVHQMRVALRRLRSVLGLFNRAFAAPDFAAFRLEAKRLAGLMGEARNWDVFAGLLASGPAASFPDEPGFAALLAQCAAHRAAGYAAVREMLAAPATTRFLLDVEYFLAAHGWRSGLEAAALPALTAPARHFAAANLARLHRKLRKRGRHMRHLGSAERHLVRIELKKLRYAAELFGGLFSERGKMRDYNQAAAALQEELGLLNDFATAEMLLARLSAKTLDEARAAGIMLGWCASAALGNSKTLAKRWKDFAGRKLPSD